MAILRFRIYLEEDDSVYRDVAIRHTQHFLQLHEAILKAYEFDSKHQATFYRSNDSWQRGKEITLEKYNKPYKVEPLLMNATTLGSEIFDPNQKFIYVYDFVKNWSFQVELINVSKDENMRLSYPAVVRTEGIGPSQYGTKGLIGDKLTEVEEKYDLAKNVEGYGEEGDAETADEDDDEVVDEEEKQKKVSGSKPHNQFYERRASIDATPVVMINNKFCIVIVGPTAVGKTPLAIRIAQEFKTQIISADSRQCFRELNIGVAKPSAAQLQTVHHFFINSHSISEEVNAAVFEQYALTAAGSIYEHSDIAIMVGGTGLYVRAFCEGMDEIPFVLPEVRAEIKKGYEQSGLAWLQYQVNQNDPEYFTDGELLNPQRMMRSLEVKLSTGRSIRSFQTRQKKKRPFSIIKIGLELPRDILYKNIHLRVCEMENDGLVEEARSLLPFRHLNALNTVGYKELFNWFDKKISYDEAIASIRLHTRHYAKRQLTWFKRDESITWFTPQNVQNIIEHCRHIIDAERH